VSAEDAAAASAAAADSVASAAAAAMLAARGLKGAKAAAAAQAASKAAAAAAAASRAASAAQTAAKLAPVALRLEAAAGALALPQVREPVQAGCVLWEALAAERRRYGAKARNSISSRAGVRAAAAPVGADASCLAHFHSAALFPGFTVGAALSSASCPLTGEGAQARTTRATSAAPEVEMGDDAGASVTGACKPCISRQLAGFATGGAVAYYAGTEAVSVGHVRIEAAAALMRRGDESELGAVVRAEGLPVVSAHARCLRQLSFVCGSLQGGGSRSAAFAEAIGAERPASQLLAPFCARLRSAYSRCSPSSSVSLPEGMLALVRSPASAAYYWAFLTPQLQG
jgi:hypothetical protein